MTLRLIVNHIGKLFKMQIIVGRDFIPNENINLSNINDLLYK